MLLLLIVLALQATPPQDRAEARLRELRQEAQKLASEEKTLLNELRRLQVDREMRAAELEARTIALAEARAAVAALEQQQAALAGEIARQEPIVRARAVELYKRGRAGMLRRLVDAASARDAMRAWRQMAAASRRDAARFADYRAAIQTLASSRTELDAERQEAERLRREAGAARAALDRSIRLHEQRIAGIRQERALNSELTAELNAAAAGLAATVETMPEGTAPAPAASAAITAFRRALPWPAEGRVARSFRGGAPGALPFNGIEIAAADAAPVSAVHEGDVAFSGPFTGFGHLIIVQHGPETFTLYGHLSAGLVGRGERVTAGQVIGRAGQPPGSRDTRLYFELRVDGQPVNPLQWLRPQ
ncbi:MAG TPA: peptidoglycan DD-metalloendopeptidase family protein [Vicinamibacterales bacterium]|nr:peptidoglycan DD-metalloendopeptidase family protein [Vicinamibacterales bacterium]